MKSDPWAPATNCAMFRPGDSTHHELSTRLVPEGCSIWPHFSRPNASRGFFVGFSKQARAVKRVFLYRGCFVGATSKTGKNRISNLSISIRGKISHAGSR
jgi:hypothetical protein